MMPKCVVKRCKNNTLTKRKEHGISYFRFPQNEIQREKWRITIAKERCEEYFKPNDSSVVCSDHFDKSDKYYTPKGYLKIKKNAVPNIEIDALTDQSSENSVTSLNLPTRTESFTQSGPSTIIVDRDSSCKLSNSIADISKKSVTAPALSVTSQEGLSEKCKLSEIKNDELISPPSEFSSTFNTAVTSLFTKTIKKYKLKLNIKSNEVRNLKKRIRRLVQRNTSLKQIIKNLKRRKDY